MGTGSVISIKAIGGLSIILNPSDNKEDEKMRYFGVTQMSHGHEYRWIYDGATLVEELNLVSEDEIEKQSDSELFFPIGGSNCSATWILELDSDEKARSFLTDGGDGPDSEDPVLVDIAEYMLTISTDDGSCTQMFLDKFLDMRFQT